MSDFQNTEEETAQIAAPEAIETQEVTEVGTEQQAAGNLSSTSEEAEAPEGTEPVSQPSIKKGSRNKKLQRQVAMLQDENADLRQEFETLRDTVRRPADATTPAPEAQTPQMSREERQYKQQYDRNFPDFKDDLDHLAETSEDARAFLNDDAQAYRDWDTRVLGQLVVEGEKGEDVYNVMKNYTAEVEQAARSNDPLVQLQTYRVLKRRMKREGTAQKSTTPLKKVPEPTGQLPAGGRRAAILNIADKVSSLRKNMGLS